MTNVTKLIREEVIAYESCGSACGSVPEQMFWLSSDSLRDHNNHNKGNGDGMEGKKRRPNEHGYQRETDTCAHV